MPAIDELGRRRIAPVVHGNGVALPFVSVVVPMRNEGAYIGRCVDALQQQRYPAERLEVIVVDGASTDGSAAAVERRLAGVRASLRLVANQGVTAARGLNAGIRAANGDVIIILGAHSEPAPDFVARSVQALLESEADCAGGKIDSVAYGTAGQAIALAMASPFGVGDARFRTSQRPGFVDTVAFGAYHRSVFDRVGLFDETLERNVDDEFNYRLRAAGGAIYLDPRIRSRYYTRATYGDLFRQYQHYGEWKVVVARLHPGQMRPRHFVPAAFVAALAGTAVLAATGKRRPLAILLGSYGLAAMAAAARASTKAGTPRSTPLVAGAFAAMHIAYGAGFWKGVWRFLLRPAARRAMDYCPVTSRLRARRRT